MATGVKKLNLWMLVTLVAGNMIGSGIFLLPASLASIGSISLWSWCFTAVGAVLLALVFAKMSILIPKTGGPYAYAEAGFGPFIGFQMAYCYWVALWVGNAAIAVALVGYLAVFFPSLAKPMNTCLMAIAMVWVLTLVNIIGVRKAGWLQLWTTVLKVIPLLLVGVLGWFFYHPSYLTQHVNMTGHSNFYAFSTAATFTLWAFIGLESATVPAGSVENPKRNIPMATLIGTLIAALVYIISSAAIMGMLPTDVLAHSTSPFAQAAMIIFGPWGRWLIALGAVISCFGALNGWTLLQGQVAMAAADNGQFPKIFAKRNRHDAPVMSLVITSALISILLLVTVSSNLISQFNTIILMATLSSLLPYFYTTMAQIIVLKRLKAPDPKQGWLVLLAIFAGAYAVWTILGSGATTVFYGVILMLSSIPIYAWAQWSSHKGKREETVSE